jgi:hypothetical protein
MNVKDEVLTISIVDRGGGFDISKLPYNISDKSTTSIPTAASSRNTGKRINTKDLEWVCLSLVAFFRSSTSYFMMKQVRKFLTGPER